MRTPSTSLPARGSARPYRGGLSSLRPVGLGSRTEAHPERCGIATEPKVPVEAMRAGLRAISKGMGHRRPLPPLEQRALRQRLPCTGQEPLKEPLWHFAFPSSVSSRFIWKVTGAPLFGASELSTKLASTPLRMRNAPWLFSDFSHKHFVTYSQSAPTENRALLNA